MIQDELTRSLASRGVSALKLGLAVLAASTLSFYALGCLSGMNARYGKSVWSLADDRWELSECLYASAITLTTVGYTDLLGTERLEVWVDEAGRHRWVSNTDAHEDPGFSAAGARVEFDYSALSRTLTSLHVVVGITFFLYVIAQMTAFFVEGGYEELARSRRSRKRIARLRNHVVVCGGGRIGHEAVLHAMRQGVPCVVIENDEEQVRRLARTLPGVPVLQGDATDEANLTAAGIATARGLLTALPDDRLNLVAIVTARQLNPDLRIVSRCADSGSIERLVLAGAASAVPTEALAGLRIASTIARPTVVDLLDLLMGQDGAHPWQLAEWEVGPSDRRFSTLLERRVPGISVIALVRRDGLFVYNPGRDVALQTGDRLALVGDRKTLAGFRSGNASAGGPVGAAPAHGAPSSLSPGTFRPEKGPIIVCGDGLTGVSVADELLATDHPMVYVDDDPERIAELRERLEGIQVIEGDPQDPRVLEQAGVTTSRSLAAVRESDQDNLVVLVSALQLNPDLRIVASATDDRATRRLTRAGARVHLQQSIGGRRMAADLLHPGVTSFLDRMLQDADGTRFESVVVHAGAPLAGMTLAEADPFARTGMRILALRGPGESEFVVGPEDSRRLVPGTVLVVIGGVGPVHALTELVGEHE